MKKEDNPEKKLEENLSEILINSEIIEYSYEVYSNRYIDKAEKDQKKKYLRGLLIINSTAPSLNFLKNFQLLN